ncbi:PilC/PilY family type IV pilus protein [Alteromonas sp. 1_MG-2023]|uniref:PilC/PilY family type IV pilus protein n=1 Tax=Alteromonas sp. 1_MG-2023 TaxID=3062669 RepID=UPI0026E392EC|nr:PilC/PilY family type IV pilus protein [Alteromonas sp. 1_MG-2023]MDO6566205.1 PilC/PilY family type IV pilus protein [Alteromonas sp. 1_MG-2023]
MKRMSSFLASVVMFSCIGFSAMGDDLDIYLGTSDSSATYNPNVLFIMDTSGSMTGQDGTGQSRMLRVQNALKLALNSATNIDAGLMRFSDHGGPILYPISGIDDPIQPELITSTSDSNHDASEINGSVDLTSNNLVLSSGTNTVTSGLRFSDLNIPQGATILSAQIRFTSEQFNIAGTTFSISGEASASSSEFTSATNDLTSRTNTAANVEWVADNDFPVAEDIVVTPDLSSVIQEIVDIADWCGGDALNILIEANSADSASSRQARAYDSGQTGSPQLVVSYDDATATGCYSGESIYQVSSQNDNLEENTSGNASTGNVLNLTDNSNNYVGIRFQNVNIPQGAEITEAYIELTASSTQTSNNASMSVSAIAEDDVANFSSGVSNRLSNIAKTSSITWSMPSFYNNNEYSSPDITSLVEEVVNRAGWEAGNSMGFVFSNFYRERAVDSYSGSQSSAPKLVVKFNGLATPGQTSTVREHLISKIDELSASGFTPIVDTLYEAINYYGGREVDYGLTRGVTGVSNTVRRNTRVSHRSSYLGSDSVLPNGCSEDNLSDQDCIGEYIPEGATYISPVTDLQCQTNNHIVLLSDGVANYNHSQALIPALIGQSCTGSGGEECGLDLVTNVSNAETSAIGRRVITHTIGFEANSTANNFLNQLAVQSGGGFYPADNSEDLLDAFNTILLTVKDVNSSFVSPGIAVNELNRLTHNDELYFALFKPSEGAIWPGNLKRYRLSGEDIVDQNSLIAVDSDTGYFKENSHSYWSTLVDGSDVGEGGTASKMSVNRNLYVFDGAGSIIQSSNELHENNNDITTTHLAIDAEPNATQLREVLLQWARGVDVKDSDGDGDTTDFRLQMGDPIHSQPVVVNYGTDTAVFIATNQGMLHSFDSETGEENFAVMPLPLLENLQTFYENTSTFNHVYGLDGEMVVRTVGSSTYLYLGMRRGGRNYYVFDVTQKTSPTVRFILEGGSTGLEKLGQTWSRPTFTKVRIGTQEKNVMIVGGGYDETQDDKIVRDADSVGNAVFMFDADTGALLWHASNADADLNLASMNYSIPGRISVIDRDNDGLADHMYVGDMGGQLFRMDIYNGNSGSDLVKGARLADFGGNTAETNRRFYYGPDVSEVALGDELYYAVAMGSGWRASPLDVTVEDNFYMIKDDGVFTRDVNNEFTFMSTISESDLYNATNHLLTSSDETEQSVAASSFANKAGWYIELTTEGEKVLASPLIIDYKIFFTTYVPAVSSTSLCAPPTGNSRAYLVNLFNANAVSDLNNNGELDSTDRSVELQQTGIAPETKILIEDITSPVVCLGTECASTVISVDEDGNEEACGSAFECLAENIYGKFERIQKGSWHSETEREDTSP